MEEIRKNALNRLLKRRNALQDEFDRQIAEPESFGITGAVNATNRKLKDLRDEIVAIDDKISALLDNSSVAGMSIKWPNYRHNPFGVFC